MSFYITHATGGKPEYEVKPMENEYLFQKETFRETKLKQRKVYLCLLRSQHNKVRIGVSLLRTKPK